jgi:hypothetical protein
MKIKILLLIFSFFTFQNVRADLGDDLKTLGLSSLYGTIGGTLAGVAVMAVGGNSQSVLKGASIGLYAGIGIGGYFIVKDKISAPKPEGQTFPSGETSKIYDSTRINDYDDIYYGRRWEMVGNWGRDPLENTFGHQLNKIPAKNDLKIFFSLFQKNF